MALFSVLEPPNGDVNQVILVKEKFSVTALVFTVLWALWHRMWVVAAFLLVIFAGISLSVGQLGLDGTVASLLETAVALIFGFEAQRLRIMSLERAGYRMAGVLDASTREAAELKYFSNRPRQELLAAFPKLRAGAEDTLGLFGAPVRLG